MSKAMYVIQILQGLLTPVVAVTAAYIAWQQWKLNERNSEFQRYERRLRIYQEVVTFLRLVTRNYKPEFADLIQFQSATAESNFLFGSDIRSYIDEMYSRAFKLWSANKEFRDMTQNVPAGYDHNKVVAAMFEQEQWFAVQYNDATEKFKQYLNMSK